MVWSTTTKMCMTLEPVQFPSKYQGLKSNPPNEKKVTRKKCNKSSFLKVVCELVYNIVAWMKHAKNCLVPHFWFLPITIHKPASVTGLLSRTAVLVLHWNHERCQKHKIIESFEVCFKPPSPFFTSGSAQEKEFPNKTLSSYGFISCHSAVIIVISTLRIN